eukprot:2591161-Pyramimonas_sp.AAC.1
MLTTNGISQLSMLTTTSQEVPSTPTASLHGSHDNGAAQVSPSSGHSPSAPLDGSNNSTFCSNSHFNSRLPTNPPINDNTLTSAAVIPTLTPVASAVHESDVRVAVAENWSNPACDAPHRDAGGDADTSAEPERQSPSGEGQSRGKGVLSDSSNPLQASERTGQTSGGQQSQTGGPNKLHTHSDS